MILYLQVGFQFIYELKVKDTATLCPFRDAMPVGLKRSLCHCLQFNYYLRRS